MRRMLMGWAAVLGSVVAGALISVGPVAAAGPTTIACDGTALAQAFETGGTYQYGANCELPLGTELTLHTATSLTLESGGHHVNFVGTNTGSPKPCPGGSSWVVRRPVTWS